VIVWLEGKVFVIIVWQRKIIQGRKMYMRWRRICRGNRKILIFEQNQRPSAIGCHKAFCAYFLVSIWWNWARNSNNNESVFRFQPSAPRKCEHSGSKSRGDENVKLYVLIVFWGMKLSEKFKYRISFSISARRTPQTWPMRPKKQNRQKCPHLSITHHQSNHWCSINIKIIYHQ
jgi:hypothetical protein